MKTAANPGREAVLEQLERILASRDFDSTTRSQAFLRHVVAATLAGHEEDTSQYAIATTVFERNGDFDPVTDPIVRIQAGRVRRSLEHYYLTSGANDPVIISLPKGTYIPVFELLTVAEQQAGGSDQNKTAATQPASWPTVLLTPFHTLTSDSKANHIAQGLVLELASELNNYQELCFLLGTSVDDPRNQQTGAQFEVRGTVANGGERLKIAVQLLSGNPASLIWAHTYSSICTGPALDAFLDELARTLAATIAGERGMVARHIADRADRRATTVPGTYEAILQYYHFSRSPSPETYHAALTALQIAVREHPDCGCCWSFLARLCAEDYALGVSNDGHLDQALGFAWKGVQLTPTDQRARATLSYVFLLNDQVEEARHEAEVALAFNPNSLFILEGIGYLLTLCGDWELGPELSRKAVRLNPFHLPVVHAGLWLDALRRNDFEEAYWQSLEFSPPEIFWHPLMQAVALAFLGRRDDAAAQAAQLLILKPDFPERSHRLIRRYLKFDALVERVEEGLRKAGVPLQRT